ncbi:NDR1/HIN1-like protein 1 [Andrographis paniculata]|uniref:NDR1/HIN1-like protein 1 n=1 Tax=Andrographis paniculata TaxID=175694 RepID=UPI0021E72E38|nr:NDR1/HIN1-like protein 1 [Andrographis paniculata]
MPEKLCNHHESSRRRTLRWAAAASAAAVSLLLLSVLLIWAILRPKKPQFTLHDATVFVLAVPAGNLISATVQVTVGCRNPNSRIGIYYDGLTAYAAYRDQQITYAAAIQPVYQSRKDFTVWSPFVYGDDVPVAPYTGGGLARDRSAGAIPLVVKINGHVKWRVGAFISGRYHLHVSCPANIPVDYSGGIAAAGVAVKYQLSQRCSVSV